MLACTIFSKYCVCLRGKSEPFSTKHTEKAMTIITSPNSTGRVCEWETIEGHHFLMYFEYFIYYSSVLPFFQLQSLPLSGHLNEKTSTSMAADIRGETVTDTGTVWTCVLGTETWHQGKTVQDLALLQCSGISLLPLAVLKTELQKNKQQYQWLGIWGVFFPPLLKIVISSVENGSSWTSWGRTVTQRCGQNERQKEFPRADSNIDGCLRRKIRVVYSALWFKTDSSCCRQ